MNERLVADHLFPLPLIRKLKRPPIMFAGWGELFNFFRSAADPGLSALSLGVQSSSEAGHLLG